MELLKTDSAACKFILSDISSCLVCKRKVDFRLLYLYNYQISKQQQKIFNLSLQTDAQTTPSTVRNGPTC